MDPAPDTNANQPPDQPRTVASPDDSVASESTPQESTPRESTSQESTPSSVLVTTSKWGRKWALLLVAALLVIYMIIVPAIDYVISSFSEPQSGRVLTDMTIPEKIRLQSVTGVVMLTFLALGGTIGSFLNVVIYRTPRHKPLLWPPSSCASCGTRIPSKDNIPVLGWLLLSGRCRTCNAAISARYPIIEAVIATVFIALYYIELLAGGDNIPMRTPNQYRGVVWILLYTKWDLVGLYFYHCLMLSLVLSVAMMNFDGFRAPRRFAVTLLVGFGLLSIYFPALRPVPAPYVPAYLTCLVGFAVGGLVGGVLQWLFPVPRDIATIAAASLTSLKPDSQPTINSKVAAEIQATEIQATGDQVVGDRSEPQFAQPNHLETRPVVTTSDTGESSSAVMPDQIALSPATASPESSPALPQSSRYGDCAAAPTSITDAAFVMALIGITLGPHAVISVTLLLVPFLLMRLLSSIATIQRLAWTQTVPITLVIFIVALSHQLLWAQIHRLLGFGG